MYLFTFATGIPWSAMVKYDARVCHAVFSNLLDTWAGLSNCYLVAMATMDRVITGQKPAWHVMNRGAWQKHSHVMI